MEGARHYEHGLVRGLVDRLHAGSLRRLGKGAEGPVYTDGRRVFKCLVHPSRWRPVEPLLRSLPTRTCRRQSFPEILDVAVLDDVLVVVSRYEPFEPIGTTSAEDWIRFLRDCLATGLAFRNVSPRNFVRVSGALRLVDVGSDLRELTPVELHEMAKRCFLTLRYAHRPDLMELLTDALLVERSPSLVGLQHFLAGLHPDRDRVHRRERVVETCLALGGIRVLHVGADGGEVAADLAAVGRSVAALDPAWERGHEPPLPGVRWLDEAGVEQEVSDTGPFDVIILSRLVTLLGDVDLAALLGRIRTWIGDAGALVLETADPFFRDVASFPSEARRITDTGASQFGTRAVLVTAPSGRKFDCVERRWDHLDRLVLRAGFRERAHGEVGSSDLERACYASRALLSVRSLAPPRMPVSLLIKLCAMDHEMGPDFVEHLVRQFEKLRCFDERLVVVDSKEDGFNRAFGAPDRARLLVRLADLARRGVIDRVVEVPADRAAVQSTYARWFGAQVAARVPDSHATNGQQLFATLHGIDACRNDRVLAVDDDLLVLRKDRAHDWYQDAESVFARDPSAMFLSPSICLAADGPPDFSHQDGASYALDPRVTLLCRDRLRALLPVPVEIDATGRLPPWHRILEGRARVYRLHDSAMGVIHVPNLPYKGEPHELLLRMDRAEHGIVPAAQIGHIDLVGDDAGWFGPTRSEHYVFVICGRNVPCGKARRCIESVLRQDFGAWGAVTIDDASDDEGATYLERWLGGDRRFTLLRSHRRMGGLFNLALAVRRFCTDPESVIVTLDLDDCLIGPSVLSRLEREYRGGADMTMGSMFATDKRRRYTPNFAAPRTWDGNVWQHLRSFRKALFDRIPTDYFQLDGRWIDLAGDWAYMVPICEMARSPRYVEDELYVYDPVERFAGDRQARDRVIERILAKPPLARLQGDHGQSR